MSKRLAGRGEQALQRLERAFAAVAADEPDADVADLAVAPGSVLRLRRSARPRRRAGRACARGRPGPPPPGDADPRSLGEGDARASRGSAGGGARVPATCRSLRARARSVGLHAPRRTGTSRMPASSATATERRSKSLQEALTHARRVGDRRNELYLLAELSYTLTMTGRWEEALADVHGAARGAASRRRTTRERAHRCPRDLLPSRISATEARELLSRLGSHSRSPSMSQDQLDPRSSSGRSSSCGEFSFDASR